MLRYSDFKIRDVLDADKDLMYYWRNLAAIRSFMFSDHIITKDEHCAWFAKIKSDKSCKYLIFERKEEPIGLTCFTKIDFINRRSFWGHYLGNVSSSMGLGAVMEFLSLEYAFCNLKLHKLCCEVLDFNVKSLSQHKKFGFMKDGCFRKHIYRNDDYFDVYFLSILDSEWKEKRESLCRKIFVAE